MIAVMGALASCSSDPHISAQPVLTVSDSALDAMAPSPVSNVDPPSNEGTGIGYKLAVVAGEIPTDGNIAKYDTALDAAEPACTESRTRIADLIVAGKKQADDKGLSWSYLELLRAIPVAVHAEIRPTDCAEIIALLIEMG